MSVMLKNPEITLERVEKFISEVYFVNSNLYGKLNLHKTKENIKIQVSPKVDLNGKKATELSYKDCKVGDSFGPSWAYYWFKINLIIPNEWKDQTVHFVWNSSSEAMIWIDGVPTQGFTGGTWVDRRLDYKLTDRARGGESYEFYIEMGCYGMFGVGKDGLINACDPDKTFSLAACELVVQNKEAYELYYYFQMLYDMAKHFPNESIRKHQALWTSNDMINKCNTDNISSFKKCIDIAKEFFSNKNGDSQTTISAIGGCHIDACWLWYRDITVSKCARSFATQILYMDYYKDYKFTQSQATLYEFVKENYPDLYERMKEKVRAGQLIPTGGTWVEMDGNLPSGESFIRQFLVGQKFFREEFGKNCSVFWLPDTFGYSAQLPQVCNHMGINKFITQKLSWNNINKFPHSTFIWEGLDGSQVLTHFPPADTYNSQADVKEVVMSSTKNKDIDRCNESMLVYGHGDGGGGPTIEMIERLKRMSNTDGIPKVEFSTPERFFERVEPHKNKLLKWVGELYFELHRGTYTSQALTKKGNRRCEFELHACEMLSSYCELIVPGFKAPDFSKLWKTVLFNQFHDILPGSSIGLVYEDTWKDHQHVLTECQNIITQCLNHITGSLMTIDNIPAQTAPSSEFVLAFNANDFEITRVIEIPKSTKDLQAQYINAAQTSYNGLPLGTATIPANGFSAINISTQGDHSTINRKPDHPVTTEQLPNGDILVVNKYIKLIIGADGIIKSLIELSSGREILKDNGSLGNRFIIYEDIPKFWDAWCLEIYSLEKPVSVLKGSCKIIEKGPLRAIIQAHYDSTGFPSGVGSINQSIVIHFNSARIDFETEVDWHESHKILKVDFDTNIRSASANYDIQFGHIPRPTHYNSSWDWAKFEVVGHRWADLSESYGVGLSLLNDCKYGYSINDGRMALSLLRSPKSPDENCDMGIHTFTYSIYPHRGNLQDSHVIKEGYELNNNFYIGHQPFQLSSATHIQRSFLTTDKEQVILETIKKAEDGNGHIIRVYESFGGRTTFNFKTSLLPIPFKSIIECNGLEEPIGQPFDFNTTITINPFQIKSFKFI
ncbi:hypothetical protein DICPUDRAFT_55378 [Dictyostelium purpureum]|uniref:Alpha-mannosidase 2C1 n=1 Tax=Dictyostelium purpureum TaxID=5786 RepID=F0ZLT2_DICPU|nr:uncharacterized protein DICPUDRAFT_55378 [Dictyostelium purpureum]EGC35112.1 hypothetical protein DICPUDRAFT_55378 [Dictyostelium purpureum]|eukprot:XP_003288364.1 hypothetical protein DICPUDRAFT_55378 [Dictyostelium purpureum]